jgi:hypothetical protein
MSVRILRADKLFAAAPARKHAHILSHGMEKLEATYPVGQLLDEHRGLFLLSMCSHSHPWSFRIVAVDWLTEVSVADSLFLFHERASAPTPVALSAAA